MNWKIGLALVVVAAFGFLACDSDCKPNEDAACWMSALKNPERLGKAIDNLKAIGDKKAEPALVEAFQAAADQPEYREKIAEIFKKWQTKSAVKPLIAALDYTVGPDKDGRKAKRTNRANQKIATTLGALGDKEAVAPIIRLLKSTKEENVQRSAARALGALKATEAVEELIKMAEDPMANKIIRMNAIYALGEIGDPRAINTLILSLYRDKAFYFFQAGLALVKVGEPAILPLVDTMNGKNLQAKQITEENMEVLRGVLEGNAAKFLGDIGSDKAVDALLQMAETIGKWEEKDNRLIVMSYLMTALGAIGDKRALPMISKLLVEDLWDLRSICAMAINSISDRTMIPELFKIATGGGDPRCRAPLVEAIGNLGTDESLAQLQEMTNTQKDVTMTKAITESIQRLQAYQQCKDNATCWAGKLSDKADVVRQKAAYELGRLAKPESADAILKVINDPSETVRYALIFALDRIKSKKVIEPIEELVQSEKGSARFKIVDYNYQLLCARLSRTGQ